MVEWYLLKPPHVQVSGFEAEALSDFASEGFDEIIDSGIAVDVELYNYDLSYCLATKAVVLHNVDDTKLKTLTREIYFPIGTCKAGMYVKYKGRFWLIVGLVDDNMMYEKGIMALCNYLLTWRTEDDRIVQRWTNIASASQYNNGETSARNYDVRSDQLLVLMPDDDDSICLTNGQRFVIDRRTEVYEKQFDENTMLVLGKPLITYQVTRSDSVLYSYVNSGHHEIIVTQDEQHEEDGYYVIDGKGYWLCEKPKVIDEEKKEEKPVTESYAKIEYSDLAIYNGLEPGVFMARFFGCNGEEVSATPVWTIENCDFKNDLELEYRDNAILISVDNSKLVNKSFDLTLGADGYNTVSVTIKILALF